MGKFRSLIFFFGFLGFFLSTAACAFEDDTNDSDYEQKARQAHEKAASDIIYQNDEWKALYYQNQQIIQLLKDIRESLDFIKSRDGMKTDEKRT